MLVFSIHPRIGIRYPRWRYFLKAADCLRWSRFPCPAQQSKFHQYVQWGKCWQHEDGSLHPTIWKILKIGRCYSERVLSCCGITQLCKMKVYLPSYEDSVFRYLLVHYLAARWSCHFSPKCNSLSLLTLCHCSMTFLGCHWNHLERRVCCCRNWRICLLSSSSSSYAPST